MGSGKYNKYCFRVEIDGIEVASFRTAGPLESEIAVIEDKEGGDPVTRKELGRVNYTDITLTRGVSDNNELWTWYNDAVLGLPCEKDLAVVQTDRAGVEKKRWNVENAKPRKFIACDFDAESEDNNIETLVLCHEGYLLAA